MGWCNGVCEIIVRTLKTASRKAETETSVDPKLLLLLLLLSDSLGRPVLLLTAPRPPAEASLRAR